MLKKHVIAIGVVLVSAITCGATFLLALYRQFALVEVAASLATAVQRYLLSDLLDDKEEPSRRRLAGAVAIAGALVFYFLVKRYLGGPRGS
jgi:dipeptide/tripeptide permease